jgi:signal transduction histidine kinase
MGGEILLKSDVGVGSVFTVTIPLANPPPPAKNKRHRSR